MTPCPPLLDPRRRRGPVGVRRGRVHLLAAACVALAVAGATAPAAAGATYGALFATREVASTNLAPFPKWLDALKKYGRDRAEDDGPCQVKTLNRCRLEPWVALLQPLRGSDALDQLERVNRYMNHAPYITDPRNYGTEDYWAAPGEFFDNDGDCEDYAIAKFLSLRALGWPNERLRVVVLQDLNLQVPHAVLAAYVDGIPYILDNQVDQVLVSEKIHHYLPLFSINETTWWLHKP